VGNFVNGARVHGNRKRERRAGNPWSNTGEKRWGKGRRCARREESRRTSFHRGKEGELKDGSEVEGGFRHVLEFHTVHPGGNSSRGEFG